MTAPDVGALMRDSDWSGVAVVVADASAAGFAAADHLVHLGASVTVIDPVDDEARRERADVLQVIGATVVVGHDGALPDAVDLLVLAGLADRAGVLAAQAAARAVPVWGDLELAWRLRALDAAPWLVVAGTHGKSTTARMLEAMLVAAGQRTVVVGHGATSPVDAVMDELVPQVVVVDADPRTLAHVSSPSPLAAVCLDAAAHGALLAQVYERTQIAAIYPSSDRDVEQLVEEADVVDGCRAIGLTLGIPGRSMLGVVDDLLVDRAFVANRAESAQELASLSDVRPLAPHNVGNALAAAALARAFGVPPAAVRAGLRAHVPLPHHLAPVAEVEGVRYVDGTGATDARATIATLLAHESVVWVVASPLPWPGSDVESVARRAALRMRAVVVVGEARADVRETIARHAPEVPVVEVAGTDTGPMQHAVAHASALAHAGDVVLLAPGGTPGALDAFVAAVASLVAR